MKYFKLIYWFLTIVLQMAIAYVVYRAMNVGGWSGYGYAADFAVLAVISFVMGCVGLIFILITKYKKEKITSWVIATVIASGLAISSMF